MFVRMGKKCTPASGSSTLPRRTVPKRRLSGPQLHVRCVLHCAVPNCTYLRAADSRSYRWKRKLGNINNSFLSVLISFNKAAGSEFALHQTGRHKLTAKYTYVRNALNFLTYKMILAHTNPTPAVVSQVAHLKQPHFFAQPVGPTRKELMASIPREPYFRGEGSAWYHPKPFFQLPDKICGASVFYAYVRLSYLLFLNVLFLSVFLYYVKEQTS
jgi:hypothetical protein